MSKELWIAAYEDLVDLYLEEGLSEAEAEKRAEDEAMDHMTDRLVSEADYYRHEAKENG